MPLFLILHVVIACVLFDHGRRFLCGFLVEELQGERDDFSVVLRLALILILIGLQAALKVNQAALLEIFLADLAKSSPSFDIDPLGGFLALTTFILPAIAH